MFYVIYPELWQISVKNENKEAAAPLMSVAAPLRFWKFREKIQNFGIFLKYSKNVENFEE